MGIAKTAPRIVSSATARRAAGAAAEAYSGDDFVVISVNPDIEDVRPAEGGYWVRAWVRVPEQRLRKDG